MRLSLFTEKQYHRLNIIALWTFLPPPVVNQSTARAFVHGPLQYKDMDIVNHSLLQDTWGLHYFVQSISIRWDKTTAIEITVIIDA